MNQTELAPILYFPIKSTPLQMKAGFHPFGKDLGAGPLDQQCFLLDKQFDQYIENKKQAEQFGHWVTWNNEAKEDPKSYLRLHYLALKRLVELQKQDLGLEVPPSFKRCQNLVKQSSANQDPSEIKALSNLLYRELSNRVQEDICVLMQQPRSSLIMGHICTPSFWDPTHVKNASFWDIHQPVPGFPRDERVSSRLADYISRKGPFVRFVWTLTADAKLDQHPRHPRHSWHTAQEIWYRVERQTTIPLQDLGAIFLIRTYVHPLTRLSRAQRSLLRKSIEIMPKEISEYKGLSELQNSNRLLNLIEA